ncbi:hypothetical protein KPH14_007762 [Odynerus spinipes]|uniref:Uncharacterized protein n=1 Tax=Odynerus spinipes TaxID=1348599 RepID=A0AAD9RJ42_9HYME|nr:hypothetical protein KPH14_007762 [Odynerus spinipes]
MDRALLCEQQARDANARAEKAEEEARALQKKIQTIENELDQTQEALMQVNAKLEEKDKALQNVSTPKASIYIGVPTSVSIKQKEEKNFIGTTNKTTMSTLPSFQRVKENSLGMYNTHTRYKTIRIK